MVKNDFKGVIAAMATPITSGQKLDVRLIERLVNYLLSYGIDGIFVVSGAGEFSSLNLDEKVKIIKNVISLVKKKIPVIVGASAVTTRGVIEITRICENEGADAICVMAPYSISPSQDELYYHFRDIADNTKLPVILYNHPKKSGTILSPELVQRLSIIENIIGIKDSSNDLSLTMEYITMQDNRFSVFAGIDNLILASLIYGARGTISSSAGVLPGLVVKIYESYLKKDYNAAQKYQYSLFKFRRLYNKSSFPSVIKDALNMLGIQVGTPFKPIRPLSEKEVIQLRNVLKEIKVL